MALVIAVWGTSIDWNVSALTKTTLFPLFGLIAFVTMWWHFFTAFVARITAGYKKIRRLHLLSYYWVFASFILHPAILVLYANDLGFSILNSPASGKSAADFYRFYVGSAKEKFVLLGYVALVVFISYDVFRYLRKKSWVRRHWPIIKALSDAAFVAIWLHSLNLGRHLASGAMRAFWFLLGASGIFFILHRYYCKLTHDKR